MEITTLIGAIQFQDKIIQKSVKTNTDLNASLTRFSHRFDDNTGSWTAALGLATDAYSDGVRHITDGLVLLGLEMKHTGQDQKKINQLLVSMEGLLGLSNDQSAKFTLGILSTAHDYKISADRLVTALGEVVDALSPLALTSGGANTAMAVTSLAGALGPGGSKLAGGFISEIMNIAGDTSQRARVGSFIPSLENLIQSMESAADPNVQLDLMKRVISQGGPKIFGDLRDVGMQQTILGSNLGLQTAIMQQALNTASKFDKRPESKRGTDHTITGMIDNLAHVLKSVVTEIYPGLIDRIVPILDSGREKFNTIFDEQFA